MVLGLALAACDSVQPSIPFDLTQDVLMVRADWQTAGLSCGDPQVGMPGPAVDWYCAGEMSDIRVSARLTADRFGVQSIQAGVPGGTPSGVMAAALVGFVNATSLFDPASAEIEAWLIGSDAADGVMPISATTRLRSASMSSDEEGNRMLSLVPLGSSMRIQQPATGLIGHPGIWW